MTRKERERLFRKQEIIDASVKLFASKGFNNTTLDEIAASSEFGKGTIYNYFSSKEEIYSAIVEDVSKNLKRIIQQADKAPESASDFVKTYTSSLFRYCLSNKEAFKLFVREIVPFTTDLFVLNREKIVRRHKSLRNILIKRFSEGIKQKEFKRSDPDKIVSLYQHLVFPYILYLIECPKKDLNEDSEINFILEVFFTGILLKKQTVIMLKKLLLVVILFTLPATFGQTELVLDLNKCIELAVEKSHDLRLAKLESEKADEQITEAFGSSVLPDIKGTVDYRRAIKRGEIIIDIPGFSGSFPQGTENTLSVGVTVDQPLFTGAVFFATRIANVYAEISQKSYYATKAALIKDVKRAYYSLLVSRQFRELSNITLKAAKDNFKDTEAMYKAGLAPEYDYIRANVQVQNLLPELERAENSIVLAENSLKLVIGLDLEQQIEIKDSLVFNRIDVENYENSSLILEEKNFTLQQLRLQIELMDKAASYEFSRHFPELYFFGGWTTIAQENDPRPFSDWRYKNSVYVGVNLKIPIFNGWQTTSKVDQAEIDMLKAQEEFQRTNKLLRNQLEDVLLKIEEKLFQVDAYSATIEQAQLGYEIALKRYSSGVGTQLENIDSLVELTRAKINYLNAVFEYYDLHARLEEMLSTKVEVEVD